MARVERATSRGNKPYITSKMVTFDEVEADYVKTTTLEADYVKTATLEADYIKAGEITFTDISGGTATLGGAANGNGVLDVKDSTGTTKVKINNTGITLADDTSIIGGSGVLAHITVNSNINSQSFLGGSMLLPFGFSFNETYLQDALQFDFYLPSNFTITSATITINHIPIDYYYVGTYTRTGYSRNLKLYKSTGFSTGKLKYDSGYYIFDTNTLTYAEVTNAFGSTGFTGSSTVYSNATSSDIKTSLAAGFNSLKIMSTMTTPTTFAELEERSGGCNATLNIYGYLK